jgi:predicted small lipoprotein YifL
MFASPRRCRCTRLFVLAPIALALTLGLVACGKKGPLIPPNGDKPPAKQAPATPVR